MSITGRRLQRGTKKTLAPAQSAIIRIACGATTTIAALDGGVAWQSDTMYSGGLVKTSVDAVDTSQVQNPAPQSVYQAKRWDAFSYDITGLTPSTKYTLRLHFNETFYTMAGERVMAIAANGITVVSGFDPYATAGGVNIALVKQFDITTSSTGSLSLTFSSTPYADPFVNAIEIYGSVVKNNTPRNLTATPGTVNAVLSWNAPMYPTGAIQGYNVYRDDTKLTPSPINATTYDATNLTGNTTYTFWVKTVIAGNETGSASVGVTTSAQSNTTTGGTGGPFNNRTNISYRGTQYTGEYHVFASGINTSLPIGLVLQFHGDGAYEFDNPTDTYSLGGSNGVIAVAQERNMICVPIKTPNSDGTWWTTGDSNADWVKQLIESEIYPKYNIDRTRVWISTYSGGSQFATQNLIPKYSSLFLDGGAVIAGGGGAPGTNTSNSSPSPFAAPFQKNYNLHWFTYTGDTGWDDDGYNAYADAQAGKSWYTNRGFLNTSSNYPAGGGHSSVTYKFGIELRARMQIKYG